MCRNSRAAAATFVASIETQRLQLQTKHRFAASCKHELCRDRFSVSRGEQFGGDKLLPPTFTVTGILKLKSKAASILQQCT